MKLKIYQTDGGHYFEEVSAWEIKGGFLLLKQQGSARGIGSDGSDVRRIMSPAGFSHIDVATDEE